MANCGPHWTWLQTPRQWAKPNLRSSKRNDRGAALKRCAVDITRKHDLHLPHSVTPYAWRRWWLSQHSGARLLLDRSYWLPMTIVLVLKRNLRRPSRVRFADFRTILGLFLATAIFHFIPGTITLQIILIFVFTLLAAMGWSGNYGIFAVAVSALIVFLIALKGVSPKELIWARGINTAAGGALALLAY